MSLRTNFLRPPRKSFAPDLVIRLVFGTLAPYTASYCEVWILNSEMASGLGTELPAEAPSTVYVPTVVFPFTLNVCVPLPRVPALFTSEAEPEDMDITCVVLRVVRGTPVNVLLSTKVPVEELAL